MPSIAGVYDSVPTADIPVFVPKKIEPGSGETGGIWNKYINRALFGK